MTLNTGCGLTAGKINMLDYADLVCMNKFDKTGALDALADGVPKQYKTGGGGGGGSGFQAFPCPEPSPASSATKDEPAFAWLLKYRETPTAVYFGAVQVAATASVLIGRR